MSLRFAPIHSWLFDQIRVVDSRTELLLDVLQREHSADLRAELTSRFGEAIEHNALEDLVAPPAIHEGLTSLIARVESREAAAVAAFGNESSAPERVFAEHGKRIGDAVNRANNGRPRGATGLLEALLNVKLVGMPCDRVIEVLSGDDHSVVWRQTVCLKREHWLAGGAEAEKMFELNGVWIAGFIVELHPGARYSATFFRPDGSPSSEETITIESENR